MKKEEKAVLFTIENIVVVVGAFLCGYYFTRIFHEPTSYLGGMWAVISGVVVIESETGKTLQSARNRIVGTLIGAIVSAVYLLFFVFSLPGYAIAITTGIGLCYVFKIPGSVKLSAITISVILIVSTIEKELHPITNAGLRFAESVLGTGVAVLVAFVAYNIRKKRGGVRQELQADPCFHRDDK